MPEYDVPEDELHGECGQEDLEEYLAAAAWEDDMMRRAENKMLDWTPPEYGGSLVDQYPNEFEKVDIVEVGYAHYQGDLQVWDTMGFSYPYGNVPTDEEILKKFYDIIAFPVAHAWIHSREEA